MNCPNCLKEVTTDAARFCPFCSAPLDDTISKSQEELSRFDALCCYLFPPLTGAVYFFFGKKEDLFVRFHAAQSMIVFGFLMLVQWIFSKIPGIHWGSFIVIGLLGFILWILFMATAYQGKRFKFPVAGRFAEQLSRSTIGKDEM